MHRTAHSHAAHASVSGKMTRPDARGRWFRRWPSLEPAGGASVTLLRRAILAITPPRPQLSSGAVSRLALWLCKLARRDEAGLVFPDVPSLRRDGRWWLGSSVQQFTGWSDWRVTMARRMEKRDKGATGIL